MGLCEIKLLLTAWVADLMHRLKNSPEKGNRKPLLSCSQGSTANIPWSWVSFCRLSWKRFLSSQLRNCTCAIYIKQDAQSQLGSTASWDKLRTWVHFSVQRPFHGSDGAYGQSLKLQLMQHSLDHMDIWQLRPSQCSIITIAGFWQEKSMRKLGGDCKW